jgi:NADPH-dependent 2,4-dienoyl-CoA reductase/sulfur reductase-like enzyme
MCPELVEGHVSTGAVLSLSKGSARIRRCALATPLEGRAGADQIVEVAGWCRVLLERNFDCGKEAEMRTSVLVVGGGVVGLTNALFLAKHCVSCTLVERHPGACLSTRDPAG